MCGGNVIRGPPIKEKRRNSEKRKEKSRDAARCRRSREATLFDELFKELPIDKDLILQMDKASIMRLTLGYLKVHHMIKAIGRKSLGSAQFASVVMKALEGFLIILAENGDIIFLSQNVHKYLGLTHFELIGHSIFEYSHPCDHSEIKSLLTVCRSQKKEDLLKSKSFFIRMKCTITNKGRCVNLKSASYKLIHCIGHFNNNGVETMEDCATYYLVSIGEPIPHPSSIEIPFDKQIFFTRHSPDMKFTDVDERICEFLGYSSKDLTGKSFYSYYHALDASNIEESCKVLFSKGQCQTSYYRFLAKHGGYVWVLTQATLIYEKSTEPVCVVCLNYVLSKAENEDEVVSTVQVPLEKKKEEEKKTTEPLKEVIPPEPLKEVIPPEPLKGVIPPEPLKEVIPPEPLKEVIPPVARPSVILSSTKSIFAPKSTVMNKNYLNFPETDILLLQDTMKDSKLSLDVDLFPEDSCAIDRDIEEHSFFNYRDDSLSPSSYCGTPDSSLPRSTSSTSPDHINTMPGTPDSCSLSELSSLDAVNEFANLDLKLSIPSSISDKENDPFEDIDLGMRAPYISMNMDDDFPLIIPSSSVMWGPQEPTPKKAVDDSLPELLDPPPQNTKSKPSSEPSLVLALLQSDLTKQPNCKVDKTPHPAQRDHAGQKKWTNSLTSSETRKNHSSSGSRLSGVGSSAQKHTPAVRHSSGGHVIMLDALPSKKHHSSSKSNNFHKRSGLNSHLTATNNHSASPQIGSHTATVKVKDKLIQVQVSVSELPTLPTEKKQSLSSVLEPPPKRTGPSQPEPAESPKRQKVDNGTAGSQVAQTTQQSVLLNLLISGEDASNGYLCSNANRYSESKIDPPVISLPSRSSSSQESDTSQQLALLLGSEPDCDLIPALYDISTYDAEVNAPTQSPNLLQGEDLLSALDQPLLRDVPTPV